MASSLLELWDFQNPISSEKRFVLAMEDADGPAAFILSTQIARTFGLRKDFTKARDHLESLCSGGIPDNPEAQAYFHLEWGRTCASTAHSAAELTLEAMKEARLSYTKAFDLASAARLDYLAIDALHMMTVVDPDPDDQVLWNKKALAYMEKSLQPEAKKWEASLRNNLGYALHLVGDYELALDQFNQALALRKHEGHATKIRIAEWMIAWTMRVMGQLQQALDIQLRLEQEWQKEGSHDVYVWQELEHLYRLLGIVELEQKYAKLCRSD